MYGISYSVPLSQSPCVRRPILEESPRNDNMDKSIPELVLHLNRKDLDT